MTKTTWFITGASSGFGMAFALYAIEQGYNVVATARSPAKLEGLAKLAPDQVLVETLDVNAPVDAARAIAAAQKRFGRIDVLLNNAGYGIVGALEETSEAELRAQLDTNFFGAVEVMRAVLPVMRAQKAGAIVNISSLGGQLSYGGFGAYSASKFALEGMSEALAQEVAPFGIKVLIVEPGAFRTGFAADALKHMPVMEAYEAVVGGIRSFAHGMDGTQDGDPARAAEAIDRALKADNTPLRLPLGKDAVTAIRGHAEHLLDEMKRWEDLSLATAFLDAETQDGSNVPSQ